jgi:hypothetical protein
MTNQPRERCPFCGGLPIPKKTLCFACCYPDRLVRPAETKGRKPR